ncbi:MAG: hypothetical protein KGJ80_02270 [Chloroflexota bacterium]|nr:hypothetical protein [Chloroflexota bacterium]
MQDVLVGSWNRLRGPIKTWWDKLTDVDLDEINGNYDILVSKLQEKYGYNVQRAEAQVKQRLGEFEREHRALTSL